MVSFSCEACGDVLTKKKLDAHRNQCRGASFTCLDCMVHFHGTEYRSHTACISEAQKYQGHLYRDKNSRKGNDDRSNHNKDNTTSQAMIPRSAYVEDAPEGNDMNTVAIVDVPPRAPTPPPVPVPAGDLPPDFNVFDFLVEGTPKGTQNAFETPGEDRTPRNAPHLVNGDSQFSQWSNGHGSQYLQRGYSYGNAPVQPGMDRFDSQNNLAEFQSSQHFPPPPPSFVTPAPKDSKKAKRDSSNTISDKKRKRGHVEDLDLSSSKRPVSRDENMPDAMLTGAGGKVLHSGLTGGLSRLITDTEFYDDRINGGPTPISPVKRSKPDKTAKDDKEARRKSSYVSSNPSKISSSKYTEDRRRDSRSPERTRNGGERRRPPAQRQDSYSSDDNSRVVRKQYRAIEYPDRPTSVQPTAHNQIVSYHSRAELFMSFVTKGPDSERGCSINKALKRFHRERDIRGHDRDEDDKELWRSLRLRRNSRGEIVLFT